MTTCRLMMFIDRRLIERREGAQMVVVLTWIHFTLYFTSKPGCLIFPLWAACAHEPNGGQVTRERCQHTPDGTTAR